jgi:hypothetical protein
MMMLLICPAERTTLAALSNRIPLANVPLLGQTLLEYWLSTLAIRGLREVSVLAHSRPDLVLEVVGRGERWGLDAKIINESRELTPAEALLKYAPEFDPSLLQMQSWCWIISQVEATTHCLAATSNGSPNLDGGCLRLLPWTVSGSTKPGPGSGWAATRMCHRKLACAHLVGLVSTSLLVPVQSSDREPLSRMAPLWSLAPSLPKAGWVRIRSSVSSPASRIPWLGAAA